MKDKNFKIGKFLKAIWDFWEVHLPGVMFSLLFAVMIYQIVMRKVFNNPPQWSFEVTLFIYIYLVLIGSANAERHDEHVVFSMVYDLFGEKGKIWMRIITAVLLVGMLLIGMPSMIHYAWFIKTAQIKMSSVLHIPYRLLYACFIYFCFSIMAQRIVGLVRDIKQLVRLSSGKENARQEENEEGGSAV